MIWLVKSSMPYIKRWYWMTPIIFHCFWDYFFLSSSICLKLWPLLTLFIAFNYFLLAVSWSWISWISASLSLSLVESCWSFSSSYSNTSISSWMESLLEFWWMFLWSRTSEPSFILGRRMSTYPREISDYLIVAIRSTMNMVRMWKEIYTNCEPCFTSLK